jgi:hypothetical protein
MHGSLDPAPFHYPQHQVERMVSAPSLLGTGHFGQQMKHFLHSNDPLFDPATLGYLLHRGTIRERNKRLRRQGIKSLVQRIRTEKSRFV